MGSPRNDGEDVPPRPGGGDKARSEDVWSNSKSGAWGAVGDANNERLDGAGETRVDDELDQVADDTDGVEERDRVANATNELDRTCVAGAFLRDAGGLDTARRQSVFSPDGLF
jgi:hypothetical protein